MRFEFLPQRGEIQNPCVGIDLSSQSVARQVFSAPLSLTSVFGMGTGGPSALLTPTAFCNPSALIRCGDYKKWYTFRDSNPGHPD